MKGCDPSPVVGMKEVISKKFRVVDVDEYKTSVTSNQCFGRMSRYRRRDARERSRQFADRDDNAARNILWISKSRERPACLAHVHSTRPPVGAGRTSSDREANSR